MRGCLARDAALQIIGLTARTRNNTCARRTRHKVDFWAYSKIRLFGQRRGAQASHPPQDCACVCCVVICIFVRCVMCWNASHDINTSGHPQPSHFSPADCASATGGVRVLTAHKPSHTDFTVTCFAQQHHLGVSHFAVLHRYQPPVPPYHFWLPAAIYCRGTKNSSLEARSLSTSGGVVLQVEERTPVLRFIVSI
jgi:hypothetical protein